MKICILGVGRSGTTAIYSLLQEILIDQTGRNNIDFIYEPFLWDINRFNDRYDEVIKHFQYMNSISIDGIYNHQKLPMFVKNPDLFRENKYLDKIFNTSSQNTLIKFIRANGRFLLLSEICPQCKFIFMIRNPLDVINSALIRFSLLGWEFHKDDWKRFAREVNSLYGRETINSEKINSQVEKEVLYWYYMNKYALESFQQTNNKPLIICYEDYVSRREFWVEQTCDFLHLQRKDIYYDHAKKIAGFQTNKNNLSRWESDMLTDWLDKYTALLTVAGITLPIDLDKITSKYKTVNTVNKRKEIIIGKTPNIMNAHIQKLEEVLTKKDEALENFKKKVMELQGKLKTRKKEIANWKKGFNKLEQELLKNKRPVSFRGQTKNNKNIQAHKTMGKNRSKEIRKNIKKGNTGSVLIYCVDITGHRHLYSAYFIRFFLDHGYVVYFCYAGIIGKFLPRGKLGYERLMSPYLEVFKGNPRVHFINICDELNVSKNELNFIRKLQGQLEPMVSLFIDGDILKYIFLRQLLPWQKRLSGDNFSFTCLSEFIYLPVGRFQALKELWLFIYHHLINRHIFVHRVDFVAKFPLLNKLFFRCLRRFKLLTTVFCPDVLLVEKFRHPRMLFLPEPITGNLEVKLTKEKSSFYTRVKSQYQDFLEKNKYKHVLLMFGDLESRKGYELLLQLCVYDWECCCVRFGRTRANYTTNWQTTASKEKLLLQDRLFEMDIYVESQELIDFIFSTVRFMILPYKNYYRTSGVLIDALRRGLPVLTPDKGVMAHIVKYYQVGRVFPDGNFRELQKEFSVFKNNYKNYLKNIERFNITYSKENCEDILSVMLKKEKIWSNEESCIQKQRSSKIRSIMPLLSKKK